MARPRTRLHDAGVSLSPALEQLIHMRNTRLALAGIARWLQEFEHNTAQRYARFDTQLSEVNTKLDALLTREAPLATHDLTQASQGVALHIDL